MCLCSPAQCLPLCCALFTHGQQLVSLYLILRLNLTLTLSFNGQMSIIACHLHCFMILLEFTSTQWSFKHLTVPVAATIPAAKAQLSTCPLALVCIRTDAVGVSLESKISGLGVIFSARPCELLSSGVSV